MLAITTCASPAAALGAAVITGGSGGIGLATAKRLAATGTKDFVLAYGRDEALAAAAVEELEATGARALTVGGDLTDPVAREATVSRIFELVDGELGGRVSSFVHAAGFFHPQLLQHTFDGGICAPDFEVYDQYQSIYPKAFVSIAEQCITRMDDGAGRLVAVTNPGCNSQQTPRVGYDMPGSGKATMEFIVRMYAMRLAPRRLCCNAVSPGYTDTREWDKARLAMGEGDIEAGRKKLDERMLSRSPMKRWADADEIAQTIAFLASEQSGLITGATIPCDGGLHLT